MKSIEEIVLPYRNIFSSFKSFNSIQSKVFNDVYQTDKSIIVSAPTGSGKTVIFELAIVRLIQTFFEYEDFKIVYVAPIKALCAERYADWCDKFKNIGIKCLEVTGDSDVQDLSELCNIHLIITTPEKWDSLTRKWRDHENIVAAIKLFMIDEVHLLNEDVRGPILETIVSRMKTIQFSMKISGNELKLRFICASATIPNIIDLTEWIGGKFFRNNTVSYFFGENERPVNLEKHILGFNTSIASFKFDMSLNYKLASIIRKYSSGKPTLIFCSSRKSVEMASTVLQKEACLFDLSDSHKSSLVLLIKELKDQKLSHLIIKGIAYHHAGLVYEDRNLIETAFRKGLLLALVCTNTLAMGVNLPAHLVIIKSTEIFINGKIIEYSKSAVLQMIGRAGRPQYDLSAVAVIMTQQKYVKKYENLMNGGTPVESHLHKHLAEHLNSEIVLQTITDLDVAMEWIRSTFLYVRACKSPNNYGFSSGITKQNIEKKLEEMCLMAINNLEANELISKDQVYGLSVKATTHGRLMARYYLSFETMKLFRMIRGNENYLEIFNIIIKCKEFSEFTLRVNEKKILNELNDVPIRFPITGKIKTNENKISCLIQANFGNLIIQDPSMAQESIKMMRLGDRVSNALVEYLRLSKISSTNGSYKSLLQAIIISKCYRAKLWEDSEFICKQLKKIGNTYSNLLVKAGKTTLLSILDTDSQTLEMILNKPPPFGTEILEALSKFPIYELKLNLENNFMCVTVGQNNENYNGKYNCTLIIGNSDNQLLLYCDEIDSIIRKNGIFNRKFKIINSNTDSIIANLIHDTLVGVDHTETIILNLNDTNIESNEPKTTKKTIGKRKIQTKLNLTKGSKKIKRNVNLEEYESLLADDELLFTTISSQAALTENNRTNYFTNKNYNNAQINNSITTNANIQNKYEPVGSLKRKLSNFEYNNKPKMPKYNPPAINTFDRNDYPDYSTEISNELTDFEKIIKKKLQMNQQSVIQPSSSYESLNPIKNTNLRNNITKNFTPLGNQEKILSYYNQSTDKHTDNNSIITRRNRQTNIYQSPFLNFPKTPDKRSSLIDSADGILNNVVDLTKKPEKFVSDNFAISDEIVDLTIAEINNTNKIALIQTEPLDFSTTKSLDININSTTNKSNLAVKRINEKFQNKSLIKSSSNNFRYNPYSKYNIENRNSPVKDIQKHKFNKNSGNIYTESIEMIDSLMDDDDLFDSFSTQKLLEEKQNSKSPRIPTLIPKSNEDHMKNLRTTLSLIDYSTPSPIASVHNTSFERNTDSISNRCPISNKRKISLTTNQSVEFINEDCIIQKKHKLNKEKIEHLPSISEKSQSYDNDLCEDIRPYLPSKILKNDESTTKVQYIETSERYHQVNKIPNELESNFFKFDKNNEINIQINSAPHLKCMGNIFKVQNTASTVTSENKNANWAKPFSDYTNIVKSSDKYTFEPKYLGMINRKKNIIGSNISKPENIFGAKQKQYINCNLRTDFKKASVYYKEIKDDDGLMPPLNNYFDCGICNSENEPKYTNDIELLNTDVETDELLYNCSEQVDLSIDKSNDNSIARSTNKENEVPETQLSEKSNNLAERNAQNNSSPKNNFIPTQGNVYLIVDHEINKYGKQSDIKYGNLYLSKPKIVKEEKDIFDILTQISDGNLFENLDIPNSFDNLDVVASVQEINLNQFKHFFEDDPVIDPNQKRNFRLPDIPNNQKIVPLISEINTKQPNKLVKNIVKDNYFKNKQKTLYDDIVDKGLGSLNSKNQRNYYSNPSFKSQSVGTNQPISKKGFLIRDNSNLNKNYSIDSDLNRTNAAEKLKLKFNLDSTYDENNFTKDLITCLISDRGSQMADLNLRKTENDLTLKFSQYESSQSILSNFSNFHGSEPESNFTNICEDDESQNFGQFPESLNDITEAEYYDNLSNEGLFDVNESLALADNAENVLHNSLDDLYNFKLNFIE